MRQGRGAADVHLWRVYPTIPMNLPLLSLLSQHGLACPVFYTFNLEERSTVFLVWPHRFFPGTFPRIRGSPILDCISELVFLNGFYLQPGVMTNSLECVEDSKSVLTRPLSTENSRQETRELVKSLTAAFLGQPTRRLPGRFFPGLFQKSPVLAVKKN